jgi:hypothetical protein
MTRREGTLRQRHTRRCPRNSNPDGTAGRGWAPHKCRGAWEWTVDLGEDPLTGKRRQRTKGGYPTRAEAKAALEEYQDRTRITRGRSEVLTVAAWLDQWLASRHDLAATSTARHEAEIRLHLTPMLGPIRLVELAPEHIDRMLATLMDPNYARRAGRGSTRTRPALRPHRSIGCGTPSLPP